MAKKTIPNEARAFADELVQVKPEDATLTLLSLGDRGEDLIAAWVSAKNAGAVEAVASDEKAPSSARKAARRGLGVLKARGVKVPERSHVARVASDAPVEHEAWMTAPDGSGASVVFVAARYSSGKRTLVQAVMRPGVGLLELRSTELSRSQLRAMFDDAVRRVGYAPTPIPVEFARSRIAEARADNARSGAIVPLGLDRYADLLGPVPVASVPHPIDAANLAVPEGASAVAASATLHGEPEFGTWVPANDALQQLLVDMGQRISESGGTGAEKDQAKIDGAIAEAIDAATDRFFSPELRERVAERMRDAAISILARRGRERAADVLSVIRAITSAGLITSPPHEIPFLRGFFQKALAMIASQTGGQLQVPVPVAPGADEGSQVASPTGVTASP
jgi:hypothetical protein